MRDLDFTSLRLFIAVSEARSISRVAAVETIVASAISKRLTQLEESVGAKLLVRGKTGVKLTPAGDALLQHAYELRKKVTEIEHDMSEHAAFVRGHVRVLAPPSAVAEYVPLDLATFLKVQGHQRIQVELQELPSDEVVCAVRQGVAPLGICWDVVANIDLQIRPYRRDRLGVVVRTGHPLASRAEVAMEETLGYDHIGTTRPAAHVRAAIGHSQPWTENPMWYRAVVPGVDAAIRLAHAGLGIAVAPRESLRNFRNSDELTFIPLTDSWANRQFVLCTRDMQTLSPAARLLLEHLSGSEQRNED